MWNVQAHAGHYCLSEPRSDTNDNRSGIDDSCGITSDVHSCPAVLLPLVHMEPRRPDGEAECPASRLVVVSSACPWP